MKKKNIVAIIGIFFLISLVGTISSLDLNPFDSQKYSQKLLTPDMSSFIKEDFNSDYGVIRISKSFLWIETDKISEYSLTKNSEKCFIDCYAIGKATLYNDEVLFENIKFLNTKGVETNVNYKYYIIGNETYQVEVPDTYKEECFENIDRKNSTKVCYQIPVTYRKENRVRETWIQYNGDVLRSGNYDWKIEGQKNPKDSVDWIVTSNGKDFTEWANWTTANCLGTGGNITFDGDYCIHTFITNSTFNITSNINNVSVLVVGGGGGGATGGGGAGGFNYTTSLNLSTNYNITIGSGGNYGNYTASAKNGTSSSFGSLVTALGGGAGAQANDTSPARGHDGGSGGGSGYSSAGTTYGGLGTSGQGFNGSGNAGNKLSPYPAGGGGGSSMAAINAGASTGGIGGNGTANSINGTSVIYAGGGGGGCYAACTTGTGGSGGGGNGASGTNNGVNGINNTGGGGGGGGAAAQHGGNGGTGIIIVKYAVIPSDPFIYSINNQTNITTAYETESKTFSINVTYNNTMFSSALVYLYYNNTIYTTTSTGSVNTFVFSRTLDIPLTPSTNNRLVFFSLQLTNSSGVYSYNQSGYNQSVSSTLLGECNGTPLDYLYLNYTFKDELNSSIVNEAIQSSTFNYYLGSGSVYRTTTFSSVDYNPNYEFCYTPPSSLIPIYYNVTMVYYGLSYPSRNYFYQGTAVYPGYKIDLYSLSSSSGISVTFNTIITTGQTVPGVAISINKSIGGNIINILNGITDNSGTLTFWLDPDNPITLLATKEGYIPNLQTIVPSVTTYQLFMTPIGGTTNYTDYTKGITYSVTPTTLNLNNGTYYNFTYILSSSYYTLSSFGFVLLDNNSNILSSKVSSGNGGVLSSNITTGNNKTIYMQYFYLINGTYINFTKTYSVSFDYGYSIRTFFIDLVNYSNQGMFGLNPFSLTLIIFFIIFTIIGVFSYMSGYYNTGIVLWELFILIYFFDGVLGLLPNPIGAVSHFPTVLVGLLAFGYTIKEAFY